MPRPDGAPVPASGRRTGEKAVESMEKAGLGSDSAIRAGVVAEFLAMCPYPHGSWNEGALVEWYLQRLAALGARAQRDEWGNILGEIPPTPGLEKAPRVLFQGHIDMVCAVAPGSGWDPRHDTVNAAVTDGVLRTDGRSSLGADNNLGNAAVLYLLSRGVPHGPVRVLFTVAEEVGLQGAEKVDPAWLEGCDYLINTDGFKLGDAVVSSAGGRRERYTRKLITVPRRDPMAYQVTLRGFLGGHSGYDINKGRGNAIKLLTLFLGELRDRVDYDLAGFQGGHAPNAIPMEATAVITADRAFAVPLALAVEKLRGSLLKLFSHTDPQVQVELREVPPPQRVWSQACRDDTLDMVALLYNGVFAMHDTIPGQVSASANVGRVLVNDQGEIEIDSFVRCAIDFSEEIIAFQHARAARLTGFTVAARSYPGWMGDRSNPLARTMSRVYQRLTGRGLNVTAVHIGLEPSVLGAKAPHMVMVSTGPDIANPHSTDEHAPVEGLSTYVRLLAGTLAELAGLKK